MINLPRVRESKNRKMKLLQESSESNKKEIQEIIEEVQNQKQEIEAQKAKIEKAKEEIKEQEAKIEKAKEEIKEQEAKIEKAKEEIKPNAQEEESGYDPVASQFYGELVLKLHNARDRKCLGRDSLCRDVLRHALTVHRAALTGALSLQTAIAVGHSAASGSGKTFWTHAFRQLALRVKGDVVGAENFEPLSCYIGFNSLFSVLECETHWIKQAKDKERAIEAIVFSRLLVTLTTMFPSSESVLDLSRFDVDGYDCQKLPALLKNNDCSRDVHLKKINPHVIRARIVNFLSNCCIDGKVLILLVAVDEAQLLDCWAKSGSRFALRCLRKLQVEVAVNTNGGVILLPIATGIDQHEHEVVLTLGRVEFISQDKVYLTRMEHEKVTAGIARTFYEHMSDDSVKVISTIFYPSIRSIAQAFDKLQSGWPDFCVSWDTSSPSYEDDRFSGETLKQLTCALVTHAYCNIPLRLNPLIKALQLPRIRVETRIQLFLCCHSRGGDGLTRACDYRGGIVRHDSGLRLSGRRDCAPRLGPAIIGEAGLCAGDSEGQQAHHHSPHDTIRVEKGDVLHV